MKKGQVSSIWSNLIKSVELIRSFTKVMLENAKLRKGCLRPLMTLEAHFIFIINIKS